MGIKSSSSSSSSAIHPTWIPERSIDRSREGAALGLGAKNDHYSFGGVRIRQQTTSPTNSKCLFSGSESPLQHLLCIYLFFIIKGTPFYTQNALQYINNTARSLRWNAKVINFTRYSSCFVSPPHLLCDTTTYILLCLLRCAIRGYWDTPIVINYINTFRGLREADVLHIVGEVSCRIPVRSSLGAFEKQMHTVWVNLKVIIYVARWERSIADKEARDPMDLGGELIRKVSKFRVQNW